MRPGQPGLALLAQPDLWALQARPAPRGLAQPVQPARQEAWVQLEQPALRVRLGLESRELRDHLVLQDPRARQEQVLQELQDLKETLVLQAPRGQPGLESRGQPARRVIQVQLGQLEQALQGQLVL